MNVWLCFNPSNVNWRIESWKDLARTKMASLQFSSNDWRHPCSILNFVGNHVLHSASKIDYLSALTVLHDRHKMFL